MPEHPEGWKTEHAVSLKMLQRDLAGCGGNCGAARDALHGLGRVDGYAIDRNGNDIVLFGPKRKPGGPIQRTDDFVVALRAAALRYAKVEGNVRYVMPPGVTLNPRPATLAALQRIMAGGGGSVEAFCDACRDKQDLVVLGIPHHSSAALVMAQADWMLKKVANSDLPVRVEGFESLAEKRRRVVEDALVRGRRIAMSSMSRLWFYPGKVTFRHRPDAVVLERSDVVVRQRRQRLDADGRHADGGRSDPLVAEWTCEVSRMYRAIAAEAPDSRFDALARLMRIFAVAKLIVERGAAAEAGLDLGYFLDRHDIADVEVAREWPGVAHVERIERRVRDGARIFHQIVHLPSCGGVAFRFDRRNFAAVPDRAKLALASGRAVLAYRPAPESRHWSVPRR